VAKREGWQGWDDYAPFYDWENARTLGRRDVGFWERVTAQTRGPWLELGCGTGRISLPLARSGTSLVGVDRSAPMLARAAKRAAALHRRRRGRAKGRLALVRADIRHLPFPESTFAGVLAPYGILQSLIRERDLAATLDAVARVIRPGGMFGIDLVPDVPNWREYSDRVQMRGRGPRGSQLTLIESVRQDRQKKLTIFKQSYVVKLGGQQSRHEFDLTFRTLPIRAMTRRLERRGFVIEALLGDYRGAAWDDRADAWIILARRR
jgi:ubiquinone/menaquinone biosynthesis C-methylase UbiE